MPCGQLLPRLNRSECCFPACAHRYGASFGWLCMGPIGLRERQLWGNEPMVASVADGSRSACRKSRKLMSQPASAYGDAPPEEDGQFLLLIVAFETSYRRHVTLNAAGHPFDVLYHSHNRILEAMPKG